MVSASLSFLCVWRVSRVRGGQYGNACVSCMYPVFILMDTGPSPYGANQRAPKRAATRTTPGNLSSRIARCPVSRVLVGQYSSTESRGQPDLHLETRNETGGAVLRRALSAHVGLRCVREGCWGLVNILLPSPHPPWRARTHM
jgi:hypothetical protein